MKTYIAIAISSLVLCLDARAGNLKFMTFNIWGDYFENPVDEREAGVEATILKARPDVVSLQEVTPNWYKSPMFAVFFPVNAARFSAASSSPRTRAYPAFSRLANIGLLYQFGVTS